MIPDWNFGNLPSTVGISAEFCRKRGILLDCRGPLIIDKESKWGFQIVVLTMSHSIKQGWAGNTIPYGVTVEAEAWICSRSLLAGCHIGRGAIVAAGTVVRGQTVAPRVIVAGNPARVIARWNDIEKRWVYLKDAGYERCLS
jgi:acetyltransferase-like isoleucine patch superfamily enzyme